MEYILLQDDDCHWYVCPADKEHEVNRYFEAVSKFWDDPEGKEEPKEPEDLIRVGGSPSLVKFTGYRIE